LYLKTYRSGFEAQKVVEQIVLNEQFPRSVIYSINQLHRYFERLKQERNASAFNQIDFMIGKVKSKIKFSTSDSIVFEGLHHYLNDTKKSLFEIGSALNHNYFAFT
jgi:uncharacterized alpha-E superfamily protein